MPMVPAPARLYDPESGTLVAAEGQPVEEARVGELLTLEELYAAQREEPAYRSHMVWAAGAEPTAAPAPAEDDEDGGEQGGPGVDVQEPEPTTAKRTRVRTRMAPQGENRATSRGGA